MIPPPTDDIETLVIRGQFDLVHKSLTELAQGRKTPRPALSAIEALEKRRKQLCMTKQQFSKIIGAGPIHYSEIINNKRALSVRMITRAYAIGVPIEPLLGITKPRLPFFCG